MNWPCAHNFMLISFWQERFDNITGRLASI
jgi:hypothetical protein